MDCLPVSPPIKPDADVPPRRRVLVQGLGMALGCSGTIVPAAPSLLRVRHALSQLQNAGVTYELAVLQLLLDKTLASHGPYQLEAAELTTQARAFLQLREGELDLISAMTSREREAHALPVRVCLYRGLLGVRLPIALRDRVPELDAVRRLSQARVLRLAQVQDWPDAQVLIANGWNIERIAKFNLFPEMLRRRRIDLFALGALEVFPIIDAMPDLRVLSEWLIAYPSAFYFFVSPQKPELAKRLEAGWHRALADGSFAALFDQRLGEQFKRARLSERRWLLLHNPLLSEQTPLNDRSLWHPLVGQRLLQAGAASD